MADEQLRLSLTIFEKDGPVGTGTTANGKQASPAQVWGKCSSLSPAQLRKVHVQRMKTLVQLPAKECVPRDHAQEVDGELRTPHGRDFLGCNLAQSVDVTVVGEFQVLVQISGPTRVATRQVKLVPETLFVDLESRKHREL